MTSTYRDIRLGRSTALTGAMSEVLQLGAAKVCKTSLIRAKSTRPARGASPFRRSYKATATSSSKRGALSRRVVSRARRMHTRNAVPLTAERLSSLCEVDPFPLPRTAAKKLTNPPCELPMVAFSRLGCCSVAKRPKATAITARMPAHRSIFSQKSNDGKARPGTSRKRSRCAVCDRSKVPKVCQAGESDMSSGT
eukprot:scaffold952_cov249-Pinguiococcus_pyrenoidosus.AAC.8